MRIGQTALLCLGAGAVFVAGYWAGSESFPLANQNRTLNFETAEGWDGAEPEVRDAIRRWSQKAAESEEDVLRTWSPRAMFIPTRNQALGMLCIQLKLKPGNLGGSPVYCYEENFVGPEGVTKLVAEYSDVE